VDVWLKGEGGKILLESFTSEGRNRWNSGRVPARWTLQVEETAVLFPLEVSVGDRYSSGRRGKKRLFGKPDLHPLEKEGGGGFPAKTEQEDFDRR